MGCIQSSVQGSGFQGCMIMAGVGKHSPKDQYTKIILNSEVVLLGIVTEGLGGVYDKCILWTLRIGDMSRDYVDNSGV